MIFDPTSVEVTCVTLPKDHCIQVPRKYVKVCGYSDPFFKNLNQRSLTLDDLWPHICWGHMCDPTQGSLCPSSMGIHQWMWIQWSILQNLNQDLHIHTYIHIHITYRMSDHIVSFWIKFKQDNETEEMHCGKTWILSQTHLRHPWLTLFPSRKFHNPTGSSLYT